MEKASSPIPSSIPDKQLPPGFRFYPSDEELIVHYLKNKVASSPIPASIIADIDLYKYNPWELPKKALFGEDEWFFFSPRDRKYPNGARPNRAAGLGYWKATGTDKPILTSKGSTIGVKKALVFYEGRPPKGLKTDWIMHEYRLIDTMLCYPKGNGSMRLDDWVLCRVRQKTNNIPRNPWEDRKAPATYKTSRHSYKVNKLLERNMDPARNMDLLKNYFYPNCPMLPYIFTSPSLQTTTEFSRICFQSCDNSPISVYDANCDDNKNLPCLIKRKFESTDRSLVPASKKVAARDDTNEVHTHTSVSEDNGFIEYFLETEQNQSDVTNLSPDHWDSLVQYQELNQLVFAGTN